MTEKLNMVEAINLALHDAMQADDMVVVSGKASKDDAGNFVVLANGVHVRR